MVYFKLTKQLLEYIYESKLEGLVGCQKYCDRQIISFAELEQVLLKLKNDLKVTKEKKERKIEMEEKKKNIAPELKAMYDILETSNRSKVTESIQELDETIKKYEKYEKFEVKDLI